MSFSAPASRTFHPTTLSACLAAAALLALSGPLAPVHALPPKGAPVQPEAAETAANAAKEAAAAAVAASAAGRGSFVPPLGEGKSAHALGDTR